MADREGRHRPRHERRRRGGKGGQADAAAHVAVAGGELGLGRLELGQDALGAPDEQPRGRGEGHAPPLALEQGDPDLALERGQVLGDRGG